MTQSDGDPLFDLANDVVFAIDHDHCIVQLNKFASSRLGYARREMLGRNICGFISPRELSVALAGELNKFQAGERITY